ncbi:hypothetical protein MLD38_031907 [Melastoma candidum]|uniref:Uncharacterized protein n=1 Tax=Melastoma candidum TaxID=119954 RepID=A0ACB9MSW8_9MYRT|nr:hypothetical protein MLD38_031907 [Melastoma candidum]
MMMEGAAGELNLNEEVGDQGGGIGSAGKGVGGGGSEGFIDRSKVRILLCDNDGNSSLEVLSLLLKCSYQVTSVKSARQVIDALNAEGPDFDIILAEVDLPMRKGMKMLKYITRDKELRRIPVIMMSALDEVSIVVKCLRLGAADYLVKPLRTNELLNLWTHMWRRRRMLGMAEKKVLICDFDFVGSDPSDANTNSTTLFSDETDDKSWKSANPEVPLFTHQEEETVVEAICATGAAVEPPVADAENCRPDVPGISDRRTGQHTGQFSSIPKKSELKIGESSAFFSYVKTAIVKNASTAATQTIHSAAGNCKASNKDQAEHEQAACHSPVQENGDAWEKSSLGEDFPSGSSLPDSLSVERSCTPPASTDYSQPRNFRDESSRMPLRGEPRMDGSRTHGQSAFPFFISGSVNAAMMPSSSQLFPNNIQDMQNHVNSAMLPHYNHLSPCPSHVQGMTSFPYYPVGICLPHGQVGASQSWPSFGSNSVAEKQTENIDRREAALIKFRQKKKERCFDKKIRYINRKKLAERRPRVRGQFVRKANGVNVDLNCRLVSADDDEDEAEDDMELVALESSPEGVAS